MVINGSAKRGTVVSETCASRIGGSDDTQGRPSPVPDRNLLSDFLRWSVSHWWALVSGIERGHFFRRSGNHFHHPRSRLWRTVMLANSALDKPAEFQARASAEPQSPVRAVLPSPAGAPQPPEQPFKKPSRLAENRPQRRALKRLKRTAGASQAIRRTQSKAAQAEKTRR